MIAINVDNTTENISVNVPWVEYVDGIRAIERLENIKLIIESSKYGIDSDAIKAILGIPSEEVKNEESK